MKKEIEIVEDHQIVNDDESGFYGSEEFVKCGDIDINIISDEQISFSQEEAAKQMYPCICPDITTAIFWAEYNSEEDIFFSISRFPFPYLEDKTKTICKSHNVDFEICESGFSYLLNPNSKGEEDNLKWLKENNLEPDKPFKVKIKVEYYETGPYDCKELDLNIEVEIIKE